MFAFNSKLEPARVGQRLPRLPRARRPMVSPAEGMVLWLLLLGALLLFTTLAHGQAPQGQLTRPPVLQQFVQADYPPAALAAGVTGTVVLEVTIGADGAVTQAVVARPAGHGFDEAAVRAAQKFRFSPAEVDGKPAPVRILYRYGYTLERKARSSPVPPTEQPSGAIRGVILERGTRKPLVAISVRLVASAQQTVTDAQGKFALEGVPVGEVKLLVADPQYQTLEDLETVAQGQATELRYYLERQGFGGDGVTVVGRRPRKEVVRRTLTVEEITTIPGTNGDALKVVQSLPGVARAPAGMGALIMRGGGVSYASLDGLWVPSAFHFGGLRSAIGSDLIESLDVYPGGFGTSFGRGTGGVVDIRTRRPATDGWHGRVQADVFDAGGFIEGPVGKHGSLALGGRRSYIDLVLPAVLDQETLNTFSVAPRYHDYQAVYDWRHGAHTVTASLFGSGDSMKLLLDQPPDSDPGMRGGFDMEALWLTPRIDWKTRLNERWTHELAISYLLYDSLTAVGPRFHIDQTIHGVFVRDTLTWKVREGLEVRGGLDLHVGRASLSVTAPSPPREGDKAMPLSSMAFHHIDRDVTIFNPALWAEATVALGALELVPGVRADWFSEPAEFLVMPRLAARYKLGKDTVLKAGIGLYSEEPQLADIDAAFGNPELGLVRSLHYGLGVERRLGEGLQLDVSAFYKDFEDMVARVPDPQVKFLNQGEGRAWGAEVMLRREATGRLYGWLAWTWMRSERQDAPGEAWRLFDQDQTHNLTLVGQYKFSRNWELGLRWRYVTGNPSTPYIGATYDSDSDTYVPLAAPHNSERMPAFHQLDVRVDKHWVFDTWKLTAYVDVQNAYNRANPEGYAYKFDYSDKSISAGLPIIPSFGLKGTF